MDVAQEVFLKSRFGIGLVLCLGIAAAALAAPANRATAVFAGGCFWCEETAFEGVPGVIAAISGYTGGQVPNPTYEQVSSGVTGHAESVQVIYDPSKITYEKLLDIFWHNVDPFQANGQFCDHGNQYRSAIFYKDEAQRKAAEASKARLEEEPRFKGKIDLADVRKAVKLQSINQLTGVISGDAAVKALERHRAGAGGPESWHENGGDGILLLP